MRELKVDVAVIGSGSAGLRSTKVAAAKGASVVMIEAGPYGTTCARVGCMPSKLLIAAAELKHQIDNAHEFGINAGEIDISPTRLFGRVRKLRDLFVGKVTKATETIPEEKRLKGFARFLDDHTLQVDDHTLVKATSIIVATGSTPIVPKIFGGLGNRMLLSQDVFELDYIPSSMAVIGAGVVGLELGQALTRIGVKTTFLSLLPNLGPITDPEIYDVALSTMGNELDLNLEAQIFHSSLEDDGVLLKWRDKNQKEHSGIFETILLAAGRAPNLAGLGLEKTSLKLDTRGMPSFDSNTMQCQDSSIFLAGDVTGELPVLHEAADEGIIAGWNAVSYPEINSYKRKTPLAIVFTDPQMAIVGKSWSELNQEEIEVGTLSMEFQARAKVMGQNRGVIRLYGQKETGKLVGAELLGPRMENMAHLLSWCIQQDMSVNDILKMPFYHPVIEEGVQVALRDLAAKLEQQSVCHTPNSVYFPKKHQFQSTNNYAALSTVSSAFI